MGHGEEGAPGRGPLLVTAVAAAVAAGASMLVMLPADLAASVSAAAWCAVVGVGLVVFGAVAVAKPSQWRLALGAGWSVVPVAVWLVCRVGGLGPRELLWEPFDTVVGFTDIVQVALQSLTVVLFGVAAARWPYRRQWSRRRTAALAAVPLLLVGAVAVAGLALETDGFTRVTAGVGQELRAGETLAPGSAIALTYCAPEGVRLGMEVYEPPPGAVRPAPVVLYVHGGGLILGDRNLSGLGGALANHDGALVPELQRSLTGAGMVVASIDYRLAPLAPWPAQLQDAKCAVRFLRAHASALGIDPGRVGVWGSSGGGQLASLLGTAPGFDVGSYLGESSRVQAVVDMFGPTDLNAMRHAGMFGRTVVQLGLGGSHQVRAVASPLTYVATADPPFLILHGTKDPLVPPVQSSWLAQRLAAAHVPVTLVWVRGAGHGLNTPGQQPTPDALARTVTAFFVRTLAAGR